MILIAELASSKKPLDRNSGAAAALARRMTNCVIPEGGRYGLHERRIAVAAGRAAADHSADRAVLASLKQRPRLAGPFIRGPGGALGYSDLCPTNHNRRPTFARMCGADCRCFNESTRPLPGAGKWSGTMRVASLESVLMAATLVSAAVVVLWGFKILFGT
jgi:hypothetical protein